MLAPLKERHEKAVTSVTLLAVFCVLMFGQPSSLVQIVALSLGVVVLGVPHGALDHRPGRRVLHRTFGAWWWLPFLLGYLALTASVFVAFALWPKLTLGAFLVLSIVHFGLDAEIESDLAATSGLSSALRSIAWGAPAIVLPAAFHSQEVAALFSWVTAAQVPEAWVTWGGLVGLMVWLLSLTLLGIAGKTKTLEVLRLLAYLPLFAVLPPLLAFAIFFCLDHSLRHLLEELTEGEQDFRAGLGRLLIEAAPATLVTAGGAVWLATIWLGPQGLESTTVRVLFQTLAALTLPHMLLTWLDSAPDALQRR